MAKPIAMSVLKQIIRHWCNNEPIKAIARHTGVSRNTVKTYIKLIKARKLNCKQLAVMEDHELEHLFLHASSVNPALSVVCRTGQAGRGLRTEIIQ